MGGSGSLRQDGDVFRGVLRVNKCAGYAYSVLLTRSDLCRSYASVGNRPAREWCRCRSRGGRVAYRVAAVKRQRREESGCWMTMDVTSSQTRSNVESPRVSVSVSVSVNGMDEWRLS